MSQSMCIGLNQLQSSSQQINVEEESLANVGLGPGELSKSALNYTKISGEITDIIKNITMHTNLLGLNASIESSKVRMHG